MFDVIFERQVWPFKDSQFSNSVNVNIHVAFPAFMKIFIIGNVYEGKLPHCIV